MSQHLHNKIGNAIGEAKRRMFQKLKDGSELERSVADFLRELEIALREIVSKT